MKFEALTIKDIAKALNLSASTVSKALRGSYEISTDTQKTVLAYAEQHNYRPNPIAQSLKKGRSKTIGILVCNFDNNFFSQVIDGIESVANTDDYNIIITQSHESYDREVKDIQNLSSRSLDGLIVSLSAETKNVDHIKNVHKKGLPIVFFDRVTDEVNTHKVTANNYKGAYEATVHLLQQGFTRIAHITGSQSLSITEERLNGYKKALLDAGLPLHDELVKYCAHGGMIAAETRQAIVELLQLPLPPEAIITASDRLSTTTLSILHEMQISIPEQIALVGFTNSASAHIFRPALSSVVQPAYEMGQQATRLLIQLIESKRPVQDFKTIVLETELKVRGSSIKV